MKNNFELSSKSQIFLENLRVYLSSNRKNLNEIEEITNELENHLFEAEQDGKPIEKVVGESPKEYMEMVSEEMETDHKGWFKYICLIIFGSFAYTSLPDLIDLNLSYSIMEIISYVVFTSVFILLAFSGFKYTSTMDKTFTKQVVVYFGIVILLSALYFGLIYLNKIIDSPIIYFGTIGSLIVAAIIVLFLIGFLVWVMK